MTRVVLVGPPGAGKGTQAAALSEQLGVPHISTGDLFRAHIANNTELGQDVKRYLDSGQLVPDEVTNEMVRVRLDEPDARGGFLLDGFPRNVGQAEVLGKLLSAADTPLDAVVEFKIDEDLVVERLLARGRSDDSEGVIRHRQEVYRTETAPLLAYYSDLLITVDAVGEVGEITARVLSALRARS
ncbi:adenylate kinase [Actinokineospora auranticolor]|uniref:Adenylate kinase n=1 Tax=Actinokineospora auranticolor TaxID=155976 RepID=A0A2S6GWG8_9PSEU|nr:adenylate kinase [Actinokineospora auranticolor]PPK69547.1 adenylate kinase [Actinokineospora auranticolor]